MPLSYKTTVNKIVICAVIFINLSAPQKSTTQSVSVAQENDPFSFFGVVFVFHSQQFF